MSEKHKAYYESPIGLIEIVGAEDGILSLSFVSAKSIRSAEMPQLLRDCVEQVDEYFKGQRREFSAGLVLQGTAFQKKVWKVLTKIPFGETVSYKHIAASIGNRKATRAVGRANGQNKIGIIIPCHRVIGSNGTLTGYANGIWRKAWLLKHERAVSSAPSQS